MSSIFKQGLLCVATMAAVSAQSDYNGKCVQCLYNNFAWCITGTTCIDADIDCADESDTKTLGFSECPASEIVNAETEICPTSPVIIDNALLAGLPVIESKIPVDNAFFFDNMSNLGPGQVCKVEISSTLTGDGTGNFYFFGRDPNIAIVGTVLNT